MDEAALRKLKRPQIQQLARRDKIKANIKSDIIIRELLDMYPHGVPRIASPPQRSKWDRRTSVVKVSVNVKTEDEIPDHEVVHKRATSSSLIAQNQVLDTQSVRSHSPPEAAKRDCGVDPIPSTSKTTLSPSASGTLLPSIAFLPAGHTPTTTQPAFRSPSPPYPTYHETREMLRTLTGLIDTTSLDPTSTTSLEYQIEAIDRLLDEKVVPRLMKVDKQVKDLVWMRLGLEVECISRFKEEGVLSAGYMNDNVVHIGQNGSPPPAKRGDKRKRRSGDQVQ